MCGRSACTLAPQTIKDNLNIQKWDKQDRYRQSYNVAPTNYQPVIMYDNGKMLKSMKWGYLGNNPQLSTINARAEGITSSPMWSKLVPTNRCAVVASGYFEWQTTGGKKQPHYLHFKDRPLIVMAGVYEEQLDENESDSVFHYAIITTANAKDIGWLHDRMPVILDTDEKIDLWISGDYNTQKTEILSLLKPYEGLECYAVPEIVNSNRNDTPDCIRKYEDFKKTGGIAAFFQGPKKELSDDKTASPTKIKQEIKHEKVPEKKKGIEAFFGAKGKDEAKPAKDDKDYKDDRDDKDIKDVKEEEGIEVTKEEIKKELKEEIIAELKEEIKKEVQAEVKAEMQEKEEEESRGTKRITTEDEEEEEKEAEGQEAKKIKVVVDAEAVKLLDKVESAKENDKAGTVVDSDAIHLLDKVEESKKTGKGGKGKKAAAKKGGKK